jgi:hypothetical protein
MSQILFWMIALSGGFALTWLAYVIYEWQERRSEQREADKRIRALKWRVR